MTAPVVTMVLVKFAATLVALAFMLFALATFSTASAQDVPELPPEQSPLITACNTSQMLALQAGVEMQYCRRASEAQLGNLALVTVRVKIAGQGLYFVTVGLQRTVWSQQFLAVNPVPR